MNDWLSRAQDANRLAITGDLTRAADEYDRLLGDIDGRSFFGEADVRLDFARVLQQMGDPRAAQQLTKAAALFQKQRNVPQFVRVCLQMSFLNQHAPGVALYWADRAIAETERHGSPEDLLRPLAVRGELLLAANRAQEALAVFQRVVTMPGGGEFVTDLASAQVLTGDTNAGIRTLTQALDDAERSTAPDAAARVASAAIRLADAWRALDDHNAAFDVLGRAARHADSLSDATYFATVMDRFGFALLERGNAAAAVETFERGIERLRRESPPDAGRLASLFSNLGNALASIGNRRGSIGAFEEATQLARAAGNLKSQALSLFGMANMAATIDAVTAARDAYDEARAIAVQLGDQALEAACLDSLGQLQTKHGAPAQALDLQIRASELHLAIADYRGAHTDLMNLVQSYLLLGEIASARRALDQARTLASQLDRLPWHHALQEGQVLSREGRWDEARRAFDAAIDQLESERDTLRTPADQRRWAARRVEGFEIAASAALEARDAIAALTYLERNRARFLDAVAAHRRRLPADLSPADREAYIAASNRLSDLRWRRREHPARHDPALDRELASATRAFDILDADVERLRIGEHPPAESVPSARELAERLSPGETAVALHVAVDWIGAACIGRRQDGTIWWDCDIETGWFTLADLSRLVIGTAEGDASTSASGPAWHALADLEPTQAERLVVNTCETIRNVVWPLVERLVEDRADALVLIPGRGLNVLPLHAAVTSDNRLAIDRWSIRYAPSLTLLARAGKPGTLGPSRTLGQAVNPTGDLPFARPEAAAVRRSWKAAHQPPLCGPEARTARVLHLFDDSDVLHFAGHGAFDPGDPLQSHLLCAADDAGGAITLRLLLERGAAIRSRAVLLSACETGLVVAEDPVNDQLGLPGGLLVAGASAVLATFWRVDDLAACLVLSRTVDIWEEEAVDLEQALARAQGWLRTTATVRVVREWIDRHVRDAGGAGPELQQALDSLAGQDDDALLFSSALYWAPFHVTGRSIRLRES